MIIERPLLGKVEVERLTDVWTEDAVNLSAFGSFEATATAVEVRRNFHRNPVNGGSGAGGLATGNTAYNTGGGTAATYEVTQGWQRIKSTGIAAGGRNGTSATVLLTGATAGTPINFRLQREGNTLPAGVRARLYVDAVDAGGSTIVGHWDGFFTTADILYGTLTPTAEAASLRWYVWIEPNPSTGAFVGSATFGYAWATVEVGRPVGTPFYGAGIQSADADLTPSWTGTAFNSASILSGTGLQGVTGIIGNPVRSTTWSRSGGYSMRILPGTGQSSRAQVASLTTVVGQTYTVLAYARLTAPLTGTLSSYARIIEMYEAGTSTFHRSPAAPNTAGVHEVRLTFTATTTTGSLRLWNGALQTGGDVWWDDVTIVEGVYTGTSFDGSTLPTDANTRYSWTGTPNASTSRRETRRVEFMGTSTRCSILRGGTRTGLGIKTDVGRMTFTLHNDEDPLNGGTFKIGQTVRAVLPAEPEETVYRHGFETYATVTTPAQTIYTQDFSSGSFDSWIGTAAGVGAGVLSSRLQVSRASSPYTSGVRMQRTFSGLTVGRSYTLAADWMREHAGASNARLGDGATWGVPVTQSLGVWVRATYTFTATATDHILYLDFETAGAGTSDQSRGYWDNITLTRDAYVSAVTNNGLDGGITAGSISSTRARSGTYSVTVNYMKAFTGLTPGTYYARGWVYATTAREAGVVTTVGGGPDVGTPINIPANVWTQIKSAPFEVTDGTAGIHFVGNSNSWIDDVELVHVPQPSPIFTGKVSNVDASYPLNKANGKKRTSVTVEVSDAVKQHVTTPRYGVLIGAPFFESFEQRITRLAGSANAPIEPPPVGTPKVVYAL